MVQLIDIGQVVPAGDEMGEVEAFKAMCDLYMPVEATVVEHNTSLNARPGQVNSDPYGEGWMIQVRLTDPSELDDLLTPEAYAALIEE